MKNLSLKVLSVLVVLSFMSDVVFIDYVSARSTVKKTRFDLMEEEPSTRRSGGDQPTMNQMRQLVSSLAQAETSKNLFSIQKNVAKHFFTICLKGAPVIMKVNPRYF